MKQDEKEYAFVTMIVPLNGKEVSGLHVPWNIQYLPSALNRKKLTNLITIIGTLCQN